MKLRSGGSDHHPSGRPRGSSGGRSDGTRAGRGTSRRNPLAAPETEAEQLAARHREENALSLRALETARAETSQRDDQRKRKHHVGSKEHAATSARGPISLAHVAFLLIGLALGAALLVSVQHLYTVLNNRKQEAKKEAVVTKLPPAPPPVAPAKPSRMATDPIEAIRLMLTSAASGDAATAYAQWDIGPDDLATVRRGQELTVADVVSKAKAMSSSVKPERNQYRVLSRSGGEARVGQYEKGVCSQVFSLRQRGPYWKLYNCSTP